jgi:hypothetical protein
MELKQENEYDQDTFLQIFANTFFKETIWSGKSVSNEKSIISMSDGISLLFSDART